MFHQKFHEALMSHPDRPAIVWQGKAVSYRELDERSDKIAEELAAAGVGVGDIVPIRQDCDDEWIAYSLGIIKCGAAYAPISASTPPARLEFILGDIKAKLESSEAMIVYYTSGSTGEPKGVVLTHSGVLALCEMHRGLFGFPEGVRAAVQANVGFDSFLLSTLPILHAGGTLYLMNEAERASIVGMHRFLLKHKIQTTFFTTQLAVQYMRSFDNKHLKVLLTGGEAIRTHTPRSYAVYNLYGPTESTVFVTAHQLAPEDAGDIPIGKPTGENRVYLIDGELCISGPQLAIGYLNRPEETMQRFVINPYYDAAADDACYARMYRTGDLAQWGEDGEIYYRGRMDSQVKISGYRIETGEIESALVKHAGLLTACVAAKRAENGEAYLAAYCVPKEGEVPVSELRAFLGESLPVYMIPKVFMMMEKLPVDARTGKVDMAALPEMG